MLNAARALSRSLDERIGWNRIGAAISLLVVAIAAVTLYSLLRDIDPHRVLLAVQEKPARTLLVATGLIVASYASLSFYDWFALRTIGHSEIPFRTAALASFTSYSIGHNIGAAVFTAALVRLRIYAPHGFGIVEIAKIGFITGLTFWLGNGFALSAGAVYSPEAASPLTQMPSWANRGIGIAGLFVIAAYLLWLIPRPRVFGRNGWRITLPSARLTLLQIGIGLLDLGLCALAMDALLPAAPPVPFADLMVTFVSSTLLGFLSHAPGSLGVLEAAMLVGLPQLAREELLASLLIYRVLYFVCPLFVAATLLAAREAWMALRPG
jgi:uncharacterized membrane protein YbhN (UPF0104 family)